MSTDHVELMPVHVQLFGRYRDVAADESVMLQMPCGATVADLVSELHERLPDQLPERPTIAVNRRQAMDDQVLEASDEIALIPPVAGG